MPVVRIHSAAVEEAEAAVDWYEREWPGLGRRLQRALDASLHLLEADTVPGVSMPGRLGEAGVKRPAYWQHRLGR